MKLFLYVVAHEGTYQLDIIMALDPRGGYNTTSWVRDAIYHLEHMGFIYPGTDPEKDELEDQRGKHSKSTIRLYVNW